MNRARVGGLTPHAPREQTVVEKIAEAHRIAGPARALRAGDTVTIRPRHVLTHDNTAPVMEKFRAMGATRPVDPRQPVFALDHDIQNDSPANRAKYAAIAAFARQHGIDFHPAGAGIGHQLMIEQLYAVPGSFVVAADSHANMYGAMGAIGTPVVRTDAAAIWATGTFWWRIPRSIRVVLTGRLPPQSSGKDAILALCGLYRNGEVLNAAVEFSGPGVATLTLDDRMTMANMTTEWGAAAGWFPADATTRAWLTARRAELGRRGIERVGSDEARGWEDRPPGPDAGAHYAGEIRLDLSGVGPHVAGPDAVDRVAPLTEVAARRIAIHKAYLVSCVNSRAADLAAAAAVLRGKRVAAGVELYVAAASREVQQAAEADGTWQTLLDAGARPLPAGCGPCIGLGVGLLEPGEVGIAATNRNYKGRMGSTDARCYLASPAVVAASAAAGHIVGPGQPIATGSLVPAFTSTPDAPAHTTPAHPRPSGARLCIRGRLVHLTADALDTDGIFDKNHTYRDDTSVETMARVVLRNYDPTLAARLADGDILLGGHYFGIGSSREQAVTAFQAAGVKAIVAGSFSATYLRNAFNNGLPCIECPGLLDAARLAFADDLPAGATAVIPGDELEIDLAAGSIVFRTASFAFPPLDGVAAALLADGGLVRQVRRTLERNN